jgi:hypothetical protein
LTVEPDQVLREHPVDAKMHEDATAVTVGWSCWPPVR